MLKMFIVIQNYRKIIVEKTLLIHRNQLFTVFQRMSAVPAKFLLLITGFRGELVGYSNNEIVKYLFNTEFTLLIGREVKFRHIGIVLIISIYNLNGSIYFQTGNKHVIRTTRI